MSHQPLLHFGPYRLDPASGQLWRHSQVIDLPPRALAVLGQLVAHAGQLVTKEALLAAGWPDTAVSEWVLTTCMRDLRRALGDDARHPQYIETVHRRGYRFVAPVERLDTPLSTSRVSPSPASPSLPPAAGLVGREGEVAQLHAVMERAQGGQRQVLFITGEAGIGKTALVEACVTSFAAQGAGWIGWGQCVEAHGPGTGYLPVLEALERLCRGATGPTVLRQLHQWAPTWLAQLSGVLQPAEQVRLRRRTQGATRERLLQELAVVLEALTQTQIGVLVLEDLHWSDPSTVDVLTLLARRREPACLVVLGTYRPAELTLRAHPLQPGVAELYLHGQCTELALRSLGAEAVAAYVAHRFAGPVAQTVAPVVYQRTAGHPLFMVHLTAYLAQQVGREESAIAELMARVTEVAAAVPTAVQQLIELQLGQLGVDEQRVLETASMVGVEFAAASVAAGTQTPPDLTEEICEGLTQRGLFLEACGLATWPDGTVSGQYRFRHALYQQVLYRQLGALRQLQGHRRIGARLEAGYGARTAEIAAALAVHFARGQDTERAITYHTQAGQQALLRSAHQEALGHVTTGLALLAPLPETPARAQQELALQIALGAVLRATQGTGAPEVEQTYARARALCQQVGETPQLFPTLEGLQPFYINRGALRTALELGEQLDRLAQRTADPAHRLVAHAMLGLTLYYLGDYVAARTHLEQGIAGIDLMVPQPQVLYHGLLPEVTCQIIAAPTLWCLGYPAQALRRSREALALAQAQAHPYSLAFAQHYAAALHYHRREVPAVQGQAEALLALATAQGFPLWVGTGTFWRGWALAMQGQEAAGLAQMHQGMAGILAAGTPLVRPHNLVQLAEVLEHTGQVAAGLRLLAEALEELEANGQGYLLAEAYRLQGVMLQQQTVPATTQAEACFHQALTIARRQQAKSWELRAAMSLSRLWQQQGKRDEARALLAPIYGWFTEGFDTADLQEAKALVGELER